MENYKKNLGNKIETCIEVECKVIFFMANLLSIYIIGSHLSGGFMWETLGLEG